MEKKLVAKLTAYLYKFKVTVKEGVLETIAKECVKKWKLGESEIKNLEFDYFPEDEDSDSAEVWVYNGYNDISFDLNTGKATGSGGGGF